MLLLVTKAFDLHAQIFIDADSHEHPGLQIDRFATIYLSGVSIVSILQFTMRNLPSKNLFKLRGVSTEQNRYINYECLVKVKDCIPFHEYKKT